MKKGLILHSSTAVTYQTGAQATLLTLLYLLIIMLLCNANYYGRLLLCLIYSSFPLFILEYSEHTSFCVHIDTFKVFLIANRMLSFRPIQDGPFQGC